MRRNVALLMVVASFFTASLQAKPTQTAPAEKTSVNQSFQSFTGKMTGNKVRLRLQPNLDGHIIKEILKDEILAVVAENNDYYGVTPSKESKAYVFRTFILDNQVEAKRVNVRLSPDTEAPVVTQLNSGTTVDVRLCAQHPKWYEINFPKDVLFWVAKEYVEKIGPIEYAEKYQERLNNANRLIATAELISQTEFRKPFQELDINRVLQNFEKVIKEFPDLDSAKHKAEHLITQAQKAYCDKKIAFLENKAGQAATEVKHLHAKLSSNQAEDTAKVFETLRMVDQNSIVSSSELTDKMKVWQPLELALFQAWANEHPQENLNDFYAEELLDCTIASGIVEPFNSMTKHKPGDFILVENDQTVAYLYSTHLNLQDLVGENHSFKVVERDNHEFAFPAYYVLEVKD